MNINEFYDGDKGTAAKFTAIGDGADGVIDEEPRLQPDKFNPDEKVLVVPLLTDDATKQVIFARGQMLDAIGQAVTDAGETELAAGGRLTVVYIGDRLCLSGKEMKVYKASYEKPIPDPAVADPWSDEPIGTAELVDPA